MPTPQTDSAGVGFPPPLAFLLALIAGVFLQFIWSVPFLPWRTGVMAGLPLMALGLLFILSAAWQFRRSDTPLPPWETATAVVVSGPYRFSRNPIYLGMALIHVGLGLFFASLWIVLSVIPVLWWVQQRVILAEEAYMQAKFGKVYGAYRDRVRRWL